MRLASLAPSAVGRELATGMWALAKMGYVPPQAAVQRILAVTKERMTGMDPQAQVRSAQLGYCCAVCLALHVLVV